MKENDRGFVFPGADERPLVVEEERSELVDSISENDEFGEPNLDESTDVHPEEEELVPA